MADQGRNQVGARSTPLGKSGSTVHCPWEHFFEEIGKSSQISQK